MFCVREEKTIAYKTFPINKYSLDYCKIAIDPASRGAFGIMKGFSTKGKFPGSEIPTFSQNDAVKMDLCNTKGKQKRENLL